MGADPTVVTCSVDERPRSSESPVELVERLARAKAEAVAAHLGGAVGARLIVGADTVVDLDGQVLGKPLDRADAGRMLGALRGRTHGVVTGVAVVSSGSVGSDRSGGEDGPSGSAGPVRSATAAMGAATEPVTTATTERTEVEMRPFGPDELEWYLDSGEFEGKAGAYAIQGLGSLLVAGIDGSYHNVVGLPPTALDRLLVGLGRSLRCFTPVAAPSGDGEHSRP